MITEVIMQDKYKNNRNGKIELLRFIFCICVLMFHACKNIMQLPEFTGVKASFFAHGAISVEFFLIVTGYFLANTAYKKYHCMMTEEERSRDYLLFVKRRFLAIFPYHFVAYFFSLGAYIILNKTGIKDAIQICLESIPNLFLFQMTGFGMVNVNHVEWYISCMLIGMIIIYPICQTRYYFFTRYIAPIFVLLGTGYLFHNTGSLTGVTVWLGFCFKSLIRTLIVLSLGTICFEISKEMKNKKTLQGHYLFVQVTESLCFVLVFLFIISTANPRYEFYALILISILVTLILTEDNSEKQNLIFNNRIVYWLGKFSLPVYL